MCLTRRDLNRLRSGEADPRVAANRHVACVIPQLRYPGSFSRKSLAVSTTCTMPALEGCHQMRDSWQLPSPGPRLEGSCRIRLCGARKNLHSRVQPIVNPRRGRALEVREGGWHTCCLTGCRLHHVPSNS